MSNNKKSNSFWIDSITTIITSFLVIVFTMLIVGFLSRHLLKSDFENYLYVRRFIAFLFPFFSLSIGGGISWLIAKNNSDNIERKRICCGSLLIILLFNILLTIAFISLPRNIISTYLFPLSTDPYTLGLIIFFWLFAYSCYIIIYSYYRGLMQMNRANLLNFFQNALLPFSAIFVLKIYNRLTVENVLLLWGLIYFVSFIILLLYSGFLHKPFLSLNFVYRKVLSYSFPRIPAGILLTAPPFFLTIALHQNDVAALSFLSGFLVLQVVSSFADPLGQVFLPRSAQWFYNNDKKKIAALISNILSFFVTIGLILSFQVLIWGDLLALRWFGDGFDQAGKVVQYLSLSIIPAFLYAPVRSILNGIHKRAYITYILVFANLATIITMEVLVFLKNLNLFSAAILLSIFNWLIVLPILVILYKYVKFRVYTRELAGSFILALVLGAMAYFLHELPWRDSILFSILLLVVISLLCVASMAVYIFLAKPIWWKSIRKYFLEKLEDN